MIQAENIGSGQYQVKSPIEKGHYTMHTCNITRKIHDEESHGYWNYIKIKSIKELFLQLHHMDSIPFMGPILVP
ncbi:MAG: hypothetical protein HZB73_04475 [Nitrosarchaeum sp.]|nr:hypothetical protein [Nitrosarchaeum sp.]